VLEIVKSLNAYVIKGNREEYILDYHKGMHDEWSKEIHNKLIVNPGSVGVHFNKNKFAEYAVLTCKDSKWEVLHRQVEYDFKEVEESFLKSGLFQSNSAWSKITLQSMREGANKVLDFIEYAYKLARKEGFVSSQLVPNCIWDKAEKNWFNELYHEMDEHILGQYTLKGIYEN
jgi:hypothetical protein